MSYFFGWFQKDNIQSLQNLKYRKIQKIKDMQDEVKAIDEKIAELKSENKG